MLPEQAKAAKLLKDSRASYWLVELWLEVCHYPAWSARPDFDAKWNFGITELIVTERSVALRSRTQSVTYIGGLLEGSQFAIAGHRESCWWPDDEIMSVHTLYLEWGGRQVLAAEFTSGMESTIPSDFRLHSVQEMHWSEVWVSFLEKAAAAVERRRQRYRAMIKDSEKQRLQGKFTLPDNA